MCDSDSPLMRSAVRVQSFGNFRPIRMIREVVVAIFDLCVHPAECQANQHERGEVQACDDEENEAYEAEKSSKTRHN